MDPNDFKICQHVITAISSKKYENHNYLFLDPVDLTLFPTYTTLVAKPMDLGTVSTNLKNNVYKTKQEFLADAYLCFENAQVFHKDNPNYTWLIEFALKMKKNLKKELKVAHKKFPSTNSSAASGATGSGASADTGTTDIGGADMNDSSSPPPPAAAAAETTGGGGGKNKRLSLSLKTAGSKSKSPVANNDETALMSKVKLSLTTPNSSSATSNNDDVVTSTGQKPKGKLSLKFNKAATEAPLAPATSPPATQIPVNTSEKALKPKLKLKLSAKITPASSKGVSTPKPTTPKEKNVIEAPLITVATSTPATMTNKTTTDHSKKSKTKQTSIPKSTPSSQSRGKELPIAIAAAKASVKKESKKKGKVESITSTTTTTTPNTTKKPSKATVIISGGRSSAAMTSFYKAQCSKVLSALKQRGEEIGWFLKPVKSQYKFMDDYQLKIPFPIDISTMSTKLDKNQYDTVADFVLDMRRLFGNCLRYNISSSNDAIRKVACDLLKSSEQFLHLFLIHKSSAISNNIKSNNTFLYPSLLYCWETCVQILDTILDLTNPDDKLQTAWYFLHPPEVYYEDKKASQAYKNKVKTPMDFGTITSNLIEGHYQTIDEFVKDCRLVVSNCKTFYEGEKNGQIFITQATRLEKFMSPRLDAALQYNQSEQGVEARKAFANPVAIKLLKPPISFYNAILNELRSTNYTDKFTKITEPATLQFEDPVDTSMFQDYLQYVESPMDLKTIQSRINAGVYEIPEDFEYDVNLIFKNCEAYNIPKQNNHMVNLSKHCAKVFKKMYSTRIKAFEASKGKKIVGDETTNKKRAAADVSSVEQPAAPPAKKMKLEAPKRKSPVSIKPSSQSSVVSSGSKGKSMKQSPAKRALPKIIIRNDGPLPLHVAIARIKQDFSCRRQHKDLQLWEEACSKFFRELRKHPWISTSKRFVFDAPVPMLHPEIRDAYMMQIKNPMDLTTAEAKLLQGGIYSNAQQFVDDVALVFSNAVIFNKSGHDQGDPTSTAYYDASRHLLRYTRWLSLEHLSTYLIDDSHSEGIRQSGPLPHWKLTISNQSDARYERENIVFNAEIEKSDEGDRFTWHEVECEKLLKSLRHQTDHKKMQFFIKPEFPLDYVSIISNPIEWETCNAKLQRRKYDTFGDIISDLRLIFTNALKYNGRVKDTDPTSKLAYECAEYMSVKLEAAIQRLYLTAADRIEREIVEDIILSREAEINQKAEEERLRAEWQSERERVRSNSGSGSGGGENTKSSSLPSLKIIQQRRELDFDNPFIDQDTTSYEESEMILLNKQKSRYERQLQERVQMHQITKHVGVRIFHNLFWRSQAMHWAKDMSKKIQDTLVQQGKLQLTTQNNDNIMNIRKEIENESKIEIAPQASIVANLLESTERSQIKLQLTMAKPKVKKSKKRKRLILD